MEHPEQFYQLSVETLSLVSTERFMNGGGSLGSIGFQIALSVTQARCLVFGDETPVVIKTP